MRYTPLGIGLIVLTALAVWFFAFPTASRPTPSAVDNTLDIAVGAFPWSCNPVYASDEISCTVADNIFQGLFYNDSRGNSRPQLVKSFRIHPQSIRLELRENVYFSNGRPLTADDVKETLSIIRNPAFGSPYLPLLDFIGEIRRNDRRTLTLHLRYPCFDWKNALSVKILCAAEIRGLTPDRLRRAYLSGSGPYRFDGMIPGRSLWLRLRDKNARPDRPPRLHFTVMPAARLATLKLTNGEADVCELPIPAGGDLASYPGYPHHYRIVRIQRPSFFSLVFNLRDPSLTRATRRRIRQAVVSSSFLRQYLANNGQPLNRLFPAMEKTSDSLSLSNGPFPPSSRNSRPLRLEIIMNSESRFRRDFLMMLRAELKTHCIFLKPVFLEYQSYLHRLKHGRFQLAAAGFGIETESDVLSLLSSGSPFNYAGFSHPRSERILTACSQTLDPSRRRRLIQRIERIWARQLPFIPLFRIIYPVGISRHFGYTITPGLPTGSRMVNGPVPTGDAVSFFLPEEHPAMRPNG